MHRFFISEKDIFDGTFKIVGPALHHIRNVLRLGKGDTLILLDGLGTEYKGVITFAERDGVVGKIFDVRASDSEPSVEVILAQGLPKGEKLDLVVRMCTEIGVSEIIPMVTQRSLPRFKDSQRTRKHERWQRIAEEAAKQCRRGKIPKIRELCSFTDLIKEASSQGTLAFMAWESAHSSQGLHELLESRRSHSRRVYIIIGPEGGFSEEEASFAESLGISMLSLGRRILRTETAGVVAVSLILYELGDLGGKKLHYEESSLSHPGL